MNHILLLEDDGGLIDGLTYALPKMGFLWMLPVRLQRPTPCSNHSPMTCCCWMFLCPMAADSPSANASDPLEIPSQSFF